MSISIIIPCYNEAENVQKMKKELIPVVSEMAKTQPVEIVVVDDGSTDHTWDNLQKILGNLKVQGVTIHLARHPANQGLGSALKTGFSLAKGEVIVTTDSDGTYPFAEIPALLARLEPEVDMVTASPYHPHGGVAGVPAYRLVLSRGASWLYRILVSRKIYTYTSLFRAYRCKFIADQCFQSNGFVGGTELMVKGMLMGYRVAEYPTVLKVRLYGQSKARIMSTVREHLRFQRQVLLHRLRGTGVTPTAAGPSSQGGQ